MTSHLDPDTMGVVAGFLTVPEAGVLHELLRPDYIKRRMDDIAALDTEAECEDAYEAFFDCAVQHNLMFDPRNSIRNHLPDQFPWNRLLDWCFCREHLSPIQWTLQHKIKLRPVLQWASKNFTNLSNEQASNNEDQSYLVFAESVWHYICKALAANSDDPVDEWKHMLGSVLAGTSPPSWFRWLLNAGRTGQIHGVSTTNFNNRLLVDLMTEIPAARTGRHKQVLEFFTKPVHPNDSGPLLTKAITQNNLEMCRLLYEYLHAHPTSQDQQYIDDNCIRYHVLCQIRVFFEFVRRYPLDETLVRYCTKHEDDQRQEMHVMETRRREADKQFTRELKEFRCQYEKDVSGAKHRRDVVVGQVDVEERDRKRRASTDFLALCRVFRHPEGSTN